MNEVKNKMDNLDGWDFQSFLKWGITWITLGTIFPSISFSDAHLSKMPLMTANFFCLSTLPGRRGGVKIGYRE